MTRYFHEFTLAFIVKNTAVTFCPSTVFFNHPQQILITRCHFVFSFFIGSLLFSSTFSTF
nr:MAG TPA: hypothetical protein [Caudoviricetes sp.]